MVRLRSILDSSNYATHLGQSLPVLLHQGRLFGQHSDLRADKSHMR